MNLKHQTKVVSCSSTESNLAFKESTTPTPQGSTESEDWRAAAYARRMTKLLVDLSNSGSNPSASFIQGMAVMLLIEAHTCLDGYFNTLALISNVAEKKIKEFNN